MILDHFQTKDLNHIAEHLFHLSFTENEIPFESTVLPSGCMSITHIYGKNQTAIYNETKFPLKGTIITGQFYKSYQFQVNSSGTSCGISFHPTAIYKLTELDVSNLTEKHLPLEAASKFLFNILNPIFTNYKGDINTLCKTLEESISALPLTYNDTINEIDEVINIINIKEGMLSTYELLDHVSFSQKTLETQFKKIIGLTPGKYIRLYRFLKLMKKYETKKIDLKDLIYMYNYYDQSHFIKDFKHFMNQNPKDYFKIEHPFINEYLNI
ncbi:MAG: AraC family transcriptional regulator [Winogradskyella sp.]|uniref:helix-turn-helix domain-containing protein n=1 Tax=Winogradskyella sp. TaxID=1883156 RepID=UPI0017915FFC|nr:AraC family transcriptional regulator [Winogradskyella sp.]